MTRTVRRALGAFWLALLSATLLQGQPAKDLPIGELEGAWRQVDGDALLRFKDDQMFSWAQGKLAILGVVHRRAATLVLRNDGVLESWQASLQDGVLRIGHGGESKAYRRLQSVPAQVDLQPAKLGTPGPLPAERVQAIQKEIDERFQHEQEVLKAGLKEPTEKAKAPAVREANLRYLLHLTEEIGWPDVQRFGQRTSGRATILLKHIGNIPLEMAALPQIEKDSKLSEDGQTYALLYDGLQLLLGRKQRYGTQIGEDAQGNPYVLPLENPEKLGEYLKEMRMPPLSSYVAEFSKVYYDGKKTVRMATREESE